MDESQLGEPDSRESLRPRVIIVSDVLLYRQGLQATLNRDGRLDVVDAVDSSAALRLVAACPADIVLIDADADARLTLARAVRACRPALRVVGFGVSGGVDQFVTCAESGLSAFVDSNATVAELVEASLGALRGELACSPQVTALLCNRLATLAAANLQPDVLTRREREIAILIGDGLSNKEIAKDLRIGPSTVKNHVHNILEKLRIRRRSAVAQHLSVFPWSEQRTNRVHEGS